MKINKCVRISLLILTAFMGSSAYANKGNPPPQSNVNPQFVQYGLNLYNYVVKNKCWMDDIQTRDSSLKKSGKIIYWYNGSKREIVDALLFKLPTNEGYLSIFELNGQVSGTYRCLKGQNFQSRYMFEQRLLRKLDKHTQKKIKEALIKQKKL